MGDRNPPEKPDEQYPLLKVEGGGDMSHTTAAHTVGPDWGVACKKNSRFSRWPEFISAVWMTLILCGISFLIFHVLGMGFSRRQQFIIVNCNDSKPASNVYYHQIIPRGSQIPFVIYTEYLSSMAIKYPLLQFNVVFLVDDVFPEVVRGGSKRSPAFYYSWFYNNKLDDIGKDAFNEFKRRYQNVNVTIVPLTKFMARTPLKYKWRLIPQEHLLFYIRVYSVWQNGGIGMDLRSFNNDFHNRLFTDRRIDAILSQHNDGINTAAYTKALNRIDQDEFNAIFNMFSGVINHFMNHTRSFFNMTPPFSTVSYEKPSLVRTHRSKREVLNQSEAKESEEGNDLKDFYTVENSLSIVNTNYTNNRNESIEETKTTTDAEIQPFNITEKNNSTVNGSEIHQVVFFYDFSIIADSKPGSFLPMKPKSSKTVQHILSIDSDGLFIAASSKFHPFLGHLTTAGCIGMHPKFAIHDALLSQCSGPFKEDGYCNNIYIL